MKIDARALDELNKSLLGGLVVLAVMLILFKLGILEKMIEPISSFIARKELGY